jgi:hypothetical protein
MLFVTQRTVLDCLKGTSPQPYLWLLEGGTTVPVTKYQTHVLFNWSIISPSLSSTNNITIIRIHIASFLVLFPVPTFLFFLVDFVIMLLDAFATSILLLLTSFPSSVGEPSPKKDSTLLAVDTCDNDDAGRDTTTTTIDSSLFLARKLPVPSVESRLGGERENIDFWKEHEVLLRLAWQEWDDAFIDDKKKKNHLILQFMREDPASLLNKTLARRIQAVWDHPTAETEQSLKDLWQEVPITTTPDGSCSVADSGNFVLEEFFSPEGILALRQYHLDAAANSGIPTRRPNGMNRYGLVLDEQVEGGVSYPTLDSLRQWLISTCVRPMARAMFPQYTRQPIATSFSSSNSDDNEQQEYHYNDDVSYAFTVHYNSSSFCNDDLDNNDDMTSKWGDWGLPIHSDASLYTLNINLNVPEEYDQDNPAQLVFWGDDDDEYNPNKDTNNTTTINTTVVITMKPGMAILHRGMHRHQALSMKPPKDNSTVKPHQQQQRRRRDQLIIWLFGRQHGDYHVRAMPYEQHEQMTVQQRWSRIEEIMKENVAREGEYCIVAFPTN